MSFTKSYQTGLAAKLLASSMALSVGITGYALAGDLTVTDSLTTPANTATGDGSGPGNIVIEGGGSIALTTGIPVTLNSNNSITNDGQISLEAESNAVGILVDGSGGSLTGNITNNGVISIPGPAEDSNLIDTPVNNKGILISGPGTFNGSLVNNSTGVLEVGGDGTIGILLNTRMNGSFVNNGRITTIGRSSISLSFNGDVNGDFSNNGVLTSSSEDGIALYVGGEVSGKITNAGSINAGRSSFRDVDFNIIPESAGEAGMWIANSVGGGIEILGNSVTDAQEADLDADDPALDIADAEISVLGDGQAIRVRPGGPKGTFNSINIGAVGSGEDAFGIINRGVLSVGGTVEGIPAEGVTIEGLVSGGTIYTATVTGGLRNDGGDIRAGTTDETSTAIRIGNYGTLPSIVNSGSILAVTNDSEEDINDGTISDLGGDAYAILVEEQGVLTSVTNTGLIQANAAGSGSSAFAIVDRGGNLANFSNTGDVLATIRDGSTGTIMALDARNTAADFTFFNSGTMTGDIYLGSGAGNDSFTLTGGSIGASVISMGGGTDVISLSDTTVSGTFRFTTGAKTASIENSTYTGGFVGTGSTVDLTVSNTDWTIPADAGASLSSLDIQGGTTLRIEVDGVNERAGTISTTGTATLEADTQIVPILRNFITDQQTFTLVEAGQLNTTLIPADAVPAETSYMHNIRVVTETATPNAILLEVTRRTAEDLALTTNLGILYESSGAALSADTDFFTTLAALTTQTDFESALSQILPDTTNAIVQSALDQQNMALGSINRRLDRVPALGFYRDRPTVWIQPMGHYAKRKADGEQLGYTKWSGGIAIGTDRYVGNSTRAGLAYTQLWSFPDLLESPNKPTEFSSSQLNGYFRTGTPIRHIQGGVTFAYDSFNTERNVEFAGIDRTLLGDGNGYELGTAWQLALGVRRGTLSFVPTARVQYLYINQGSYIEEGGGNGLNLSVPSNTVDSLRGSLGLAARKAFLQEDNTNLEFEVRSTFTREFMTGTQDLEYAFAAGGPTFTLEGAKHLQNVFSLGLGVFYKNEHATVAFDYDGEKASGYTAHTGAVTVRFRF